MSSQDLAGSEPAKTAESEPETDTSSTPETPCPVVDSLEQIGSRWRLVVLHELLNGESRFNELKRETDANARTLSRVLDDPRTDRLRRPPTGGRLARRDVHSLTPKGESLAPVFEEIDEWAHEWLAECSG